MIKIGVSACFLYPDPTRAFFAPKTLCYLENDMANFLFKEDVLPVLIPDLPEPGLLNFLSKMDGFVFQGGSDVSPESYGEAFLDKEKWPGDKYRDNYELKIADYAFKHKRPMLGICRGAQLLNVYFGGSLYQDLQTQNHQSLTHRDADLYDTNCHPIKFMPDNNLAKIYKTENPKVCSVHHQGINKLGKDLVIEAVSPKDELIEAFSHKDMRTNFVLGVQWHPEFSRSVNDSHLHADPLYNYFLAAVKKGKEE